MNLDDLLQVVVVAPECLAEHEVVFLEDPDLEVFQIAELTLEAIFVVVRNVGDARVRDGNVEARFIRRSCNSEQ